MTKRHRIKVSETSKYKSILKNLDSVNSFHNYAIDKMPKDFSISAKSEDDVIEAMVHNTLGIFAQMWHSERESPFCQAELEVFKKVFSKNLS